MTILRAIYVVPHAEATHHVNGLVGGWYDSELTVKGLRDAESVAKALATQIPIGAAVELRCSDLKRARQTADPIAALLGVEAIVDSDLREQSYGIAEGKPGGTHAPAPAPAAGDRLSHHDGVDGSETTFQLATRAYAAFDRVTAGNAEHSVVVTHGGPVTFLIARWIGMPIETVGHVRFGTSPASITVLQEDASYRSHEVARLNDVRHLA